MASTPTSSIPRGQGSRDDDGLHLESDADEQLLIYVPFLQVIKLHSVVIVGPEEEGALELSHNIMLQN
ncbi:hypothetical protein BHE74_00013712 [Ensete ventricosum]|nr:hypothetical protein GW17_00031459 [Ensete ventricosum]RWW78091.1 hypothetical protein BHE74_00013712 [Ensete ventricosum]RZR92860.1 hypothetical protein BHM03_00021221 [Ensete ventricosum]